MAAARRVGCRLGPVRAGRVVVLAARGLSGSELPLGGPWLAEVAFGRLMVTRQERTASPASWSLGKGAGVGAWDRWRVRWRTEPAPERQERASLTAWFTPTSLTLRRAEPGERLRPLGGRGRRLLVRCFQDARVPRRRRTRWPVLAGPDGVVWIPGVCRSDALLPPAGTEAVRVDAEYA